MAIIQKILLGIALVVNAAACGDRKAPANTSTETTTASAPAFNKQGELSFISKATGDTIRSIDVELATTNEQRATGLMYRKSMDESQGMLFIFPEAGQQSFYMKNTYISLDIVYVNADKEIVSVQKYATPLSEESLPSYKDAMYVVEVNAGFIDKHKIVFGDKIAFTTSK
ncbi:DUF192 domain-containing protein [uncultured Chitinophaga sp.]|uniref:DUF192 domain-containing protein n=1 Tax=uncultured Chitinophaga sp. TaxID=339340 RepID=UPI0025D39E2E|nr:DUF192 domain-containing protein [uncultured Chitinophaga sp.]